MSSSDRAAVVFTYKSVEHICSDGGTQSWRMHESHFGEFEYVICTRNRRRIGVEGPEAHGAAFLIGKVRDIVPAPEGSDPGKPRFLIRMSEAAVIRDKPNFWQWGRWPTHYDRLEALGIDPNAYDFKPLPEILAEVRELSGDFPAAGSRPSLLGFDRQTLKEAIEEAKVSLAVKLGVEVAAIEVAVRM